MTKIADVLRPIGAGCRSTQLGERDRIPTAIKRILVPTDLTNESERAIEFGFVLAKLFGARLTLLDIYKEHAPNPVGAPIEGPPGGGEGTQLIHAAEANCP